MILKLKLKVNKFIEILNDGIKLSKIGLEFSKSATSKYLRFNIASELISRTASFLRTIVLGLFINNLVGGGNQQILYLFLLIIVLLELTDGIVINYLDSKVRLYQQFVDQSIFELMVDKYKSIPIKFRNEENFLEIDRNLKPGTFVTLIDSYILIFSNMYSVLIAFLAISIIDYKILIVSIIVALISLNLKFKNRLLEFELKDERSYNSYLLGTTQSNFKMSEINTLSDNIKIENNFKFFYEKYLDAKNKFEEYFKNYFYKIEKYKLYSLYILSIALAGIMGYLYNLGINGVMQIGTLTILISSYSRLLNNLYGITNITSGIMGKYLEIQSFVKFFEYSKYEENQENLKTAKNFEIEFKNVWFKYPGTDNFVLEDVNFKINSKDKLGIIGVNGAGKSTLTKLLFNLYLPTKGEILLNGQNINFIKDEEYFEIMTSLSQNKTLEQNLTIEELIYLGNTSKRIDIKKVIASAKGTLANKFIEKFDKKYKQKIATVDTSRLTQINKFSEDKYSNLSPGEKRRILISRVIYSERPIIVLDEPTSDVDQLATNEIFNSLSKIKNNEILILISHDILRVNKIVNKILILEYGKVIEFDEKTNLLKSKNSRYKYLLENYKDEVKL